MIKGTKNTNQTGKNTVRLNTNLAKAVYKLDSAILLLLNSSKAS